MQEAVVEQRARSHEARDLASNDAATAAASCSLGSSVLDLIAHGDHDASFDQSFEIVIECMSRNATHGYGGLLARGRGALASSLDVSRRERDVEYGGGLDGVVVEHLVEVAQSEQQQEAWSLLLHAEVLAHRWCRCVVRLLS